VCARRTLHSNTVTHLFEVPTMDCFERHVSRILRDCMTLREADQFWVVTRRMLRMVLCPKCAVRHAVFTPTRPDQANYPVQAHKVVENRKSTVQTFGARVPLYWKLPTSTSGWSELGSVHVKTDLGAASKHAQVPISSVLHAQRKSAT
jgi:hypothetical protein